MKKFFTLMLMLGVAWMASAQMLDPAKWTYKVTYPNETEAELVFTAQLEEGWHLYSQRTDPNGPIGISFEFNKTGDYELVGGVREPNPHEAYDEDFKCTVRSFSGKVVFRQKVKRLTEKNFTVTGTFSYQLCNDGSCIAPDDRDFSFKVNGAAGAEPVAATGDGNNDTAVASDVAPAQTDTAVVAADEPTTSAEPEGKEEKSLLALFFGALLAGIVTMFTPCVFPMIPMTVNFFMHSSDNKRKNRRQALFFGGSIIFMFAVLGAILTLFLGPESLNVIGTHGVPNLIFFIIFFVFALSFFGLFEIKMPEKWVNASDAQADKGGLMAPFFIALTTVLVSFSCTGPIIGAALVELATSTTNRWISLVSMLGFGIGFALPFTLLAFFPAVLKNMKSGGWLNSVKIVFAFLELAFGLKFLQMADLYWSWGILDREVYLALWIVIFGLMGFYLLGKLKFKGDEEVKQIGVVRLFFAIASLTFTVYMIPGLFGAPLNGISGFLPPMHTQDFNIEKIVVENKGQAVATVDYNGFPTDRKYADKLHEPLGYHGFFDIEEAKAYARQTGKPIFIDFTGINCNNCRKMEQYVLSNQDVKDFMNENYVLCELFCDMNDIKLPEEEWVKDGDRTITTLGRRNLFYQRTQYNMNAQPYYVIIDVDGKQLTADNFAYNPDPAKFLDFLKEGVECYEARR